MSAPGVFVKPRARPRPTSPLPRIPAQVYPETFDTTELRIGNGYSRPKMSGMMPLNTTSYGAAFHGAPINALLKMSVLASWTTSATAISGLASEAPVSWTAAETRPAATPEWAARWA